MLYNYTSESGSYSSMDLVNYIASATIDGVNPYTPRIIESDNISSKKPMHTSTTTFTQATG